ncbi:hypothetical protein [Litoribacter ruber]|uniref:hypothetical protein n=1 Tax=Litoribacter ruber TaxID=702568 RepID=UPI00293D9EA7|nr:hypothetical protein [Litoribacter alkaliphilus]
MKPRTGVRGLNFSILLYHYHVLMGFYYGWFAYGTDTSFYWNLGDKFRQFNFESWFDAYGTHNYFVFFLNYPFSRVLGLDFWTGTFLYSSVSSWAFILLFLIGEGFFKEKIKMRILGIGIWPGILLLPSLHFWSSGIGKDSLIFLFMVMFFYGIRDLRKYVVLVAISSLLIYHVRPHMAFVILFSASMMLLLDSKLHFSYKIIFFTIAVFGFVLIYGEVLKFLKIDELSTENIDALFNTTSGNLSYGRSFVDMSGYPYPLKVFTFLFRPLFFDAHNFSSFLNSIENFICLFLAIHIGMKTNLIKTYKNSPNAIKIMLITFVIASLAFAGSMSNFGIMVRMKNMTFIYFLFFLLFSYYSFLKEQKIKKIIRLMKIKERLELKSAT